MIANSHSIDIFMLAQAPCLVRGVGYATPRPVSHAPFLNRFLMCMRPARDPHFTLSRSSISILS
jgi:hypothetical protein